MTASSRNDMTETRPAPPSTVEVTIAAIVSVNRIARGRWMRNLPNKASPATLAAMISSGRASLRSWKLNENRDRKTLPISGSSSSTRVAVSPRARAAPAATTAGAKADSLPVSVMAALLEDPAVVDQPVDGAFDRLADAELWFPAERPHAPRVEPDERIVADPALAAAGIAEPRSAAEPRRDPGDRIVDPAVFVGAEIVDAEPALRPLQRRQHRRDAIADMKVRFALRAIAEDVQPGRVGEQAADKIENVTVAVALAEHADKAEDQAAQAVALAVGGDQPLAGQLRGAVERGLDRKRRILGGGDGRRLAVDRAGRGEAQGLDPGLAHRLKQVERRQRVLFEVAAGVLQPVPDIGVGGHVKDDVGAGDRRGEPLGVEQVALDQAEPGLLPRRFEKPGIAGRKIVVAGNRIAARQQPVDKVAGDEPGGAGDKGMHRPSSSKPGLAHQLGAHRALPQKLRQAMHQRLVQVFHHPVIVGGDVQVDVGEAGAAPAGKAGHRDGADAVATQIGRAHV